MRAILAIAAAAAALATVAAARVPKWHELTAEYSYEQYLADFGKPTPKKGERVHREKLFRTKLAEVMAHNAQPGVKWRKGINHMSDWTQTEFRALMGRKAAAGVDSGVKPLSVFEATMAPEALPASVDWRTSGVVTPVKDQ
jgi:cathepsin L